MEARFIVLQRYLEALGVGTAIETIDQRRTIQKAVYLGQELAGVNLGYWYAWGATGPHSEEVARGCHEIAQAHAAGDLPGPDQELLPAVASPLKALQPLLQVPEGVSLTQPEWLETLAVLVYLRKERSRRALLESMRFEKPHAKRASTAIRAFKRRFRATGRG